MTAYSRQSAYDKRRREAGWKRVPVWISPDLLAHLMAFRAPRGLSEQAAIVRAIQLAASEIGNTQ